MPKIIIKKKEECPLKSKKFSIGMEKLRNMYKPPLWKLKKEKREVWLAKWSMFWRVLGGCKLAILWHSHFPENFPIGWVVKIIGMEMGAAICFIIIILPMGSRKRKKKKSEKELIN